VPFTKSGELRIPAWFPEYTCNQMRERPSINNFKQTLTAGCMNSHNDHEDLCRCPLHGCTSGLLGHSLNRSPLCACDPVSSSALPPTLATRLGSGSTGEGQDITWPSVSHASITAGTGVCTNADS
jgi:hypothetical protein